MRDYALRPKEERKTPAQSFKMKLHIKQRSAAEKESPVLADGCHTVPSQLVYKTIM